MATAADVRIKLTRIELKNFRCFGKTTLNLRDPITGGPLCTALFVGPNGTGKSSVLAAIASLFGQLQDLYEADRLTREDIRDGTDLATLRADWMDIIDGQPGKFLAEIAILRQRISVWDQELPAGIHLKDRVRGEPSVSRWVAADSDASPSQAGLILFFDGNRLLPPHGVTGPNIAT